MNHDENLCAEILSTLPLYVGGDLEAKALSEVRSHLVACPACAERALAARAARRELVAALRIESTPGPDLWAGVRAALADEGVLRPLAPAPLLARPRGRSWTFVAAAAVVVAIGGAALWSNHARPEVPLGPGPIARDSTPVPARPQADSATDLAVVPTGSGGLRRLVPGERQLRESAPLILNDSPYLYGTPPRNGAAMQPVGLRRVDPNAPRW